MVTIEKVLIGIVYCCLHALLSEQSNATIKVGVLLMTEDPAPFDLRRVGPALDIGLERAVNETGINFIFVLKDYPGSCPLQTTIGRFAELAYDDNVSAVIGPACSHTLEASGRLAAYLGVPVVTGVGDLVLRKPGDMYESLTILSYNIRKLSDSMKTVFCHYEWHHTAIFYDETDYFMNVAGENLVHDLKISPNFSRPFDFPFDPDHVTDYGTFLLEARKHARVFIILCNAETFRDILYRSYELGLANGDFVFITLELFPSSSLGYYMEFIRNDTKDAGVTKAYESVLIFTIRKLNDPHFVDFANEVKQRANTSYNYTFGPTEEVNYFITAFHDSVLYLANAYKAVMDDGEDITNGTHVAQKLWGNVFNGVLGEVKIDELGNRIADFDLFDMGDPDTKQFQAVGHFHGSTMQYTPINAVNIVWPNGKPVDKPVCGFSDELCIHSPEDLTMTFVIVAVVLVVVIIIGSTCGVFLYRKYKLESEIGRKEWLVDFHEVQHRKSRANDSFMSRASLSVDVKDEYEQVFTQTAYCRNNVVAIRKLNLKQISLTRSLALELNQIYLLNHANLAKFVGACIEPNHVYLLMEYGPRGSLQDLIHNESIELDYSFRYSLIGDIVKGMCALHSSAVKVHGRLSSANCVIDSRFALKLTDFGPKSLLMKDRIEELYKAEKYNMFFNKRKLFWTAPEHLRQTLGKGAPYSQKGDVFSFAIILQEICTRSEPYEGNHLDVEEIITGLKKGGKRPLRPDVHEDSFESPELLSLMMTCWAENPSERPTFTEINETFRRLKNKSGVTTNIIDNLLQRMSNYADNLETLAAERTKSYLEEKQKVEELLHRLLPELVAQQLQAGRTVVPEYFDCVSVYFSDIVGFSSIAARSKPVEIVDLLNDMYAAFDSTIERFNVYKVETTGDAYMCVSGLPIVVENEHVKNICNMALKIRQTAKNFKIKHMPKELLRVRIGIHSGPVVAGVVGLTMPKYCLFGDTVHIASIIESNSEAMKIHLSEDTKIILEAFPEFKVEKRGWIEVKNKERMATYWLLEKKHTEDDDFIELDHADSSIHEFLRKSKLQPIYINSLFSTSSIGSKRSSEFK